MSNSEHHPSPSHANWFIGFVTLLFGPKMFTMLTTGFSSGFPLLLTGRTLKVWMREEGVDLTTIGLFAFVGLPYTLKFLWAPLLDRFIPTQLGRRRSWMMISQFALMLFIALMALINPAQSPLVLAIVCLCITFSSATQDIVLDAYRRERLNDEELGIGSSIFVWGYRIGMWVAAGLALILADTFSWPLIYLFLAAWMAVGLVTTLVITEPQTEVPPPQSLQEAVIGPFKEFFKRKEAILILSFILLYKLGDQMASDMVAPLVIDQGYTKTQMGTIISTFGMGILILGGLLGGMVVYKIGIIRSLVIFGILQMISTAGYALLAQTPNSILLLTVVVGFEDLSAGLGTTAYIAYMASVTNKKFTATQYALLTSMMGVPRVILGSSTGYLAETLGYSTFFISCALIAVPGLLLIYKIAQYHQPEEHIQS